MRSIKDFGREGKKEGTQTLKEEVASVAAKYAGKSEEELIRTLRQNVAQAKREGSFSVEQLDGFVSVVSPSLDEHSRQRLMALVEMIKGE